MSDTLKISDRLAHLQTMKLSDMQDIQGDLKELPDHKYEKLYRLLVKHGIILPFAVWTQDNSLLDGNQRKKVILDNWGDLEMPVILIDADTLEDAKGILLAISSQFGEITESGLEAFGLDMADVKMNYSFDRLPYTFHDAQAKPRVDVASLYQGMPDYTSEALYKKRGSQKLVLWVHENKHEELGKLLGQKITDKTKTVHYPLSGAIKFDSKSWEWSDDV